ncbi:hypothetical protein [Sinomonas humi]|nr:hypothetical protein [Sinomonas humi]
MTLAASVPMRDLLDPVPQELEKIELGAWDVRVLAQDPDCAPKDDTGP